MRRAPDALRLCNVFGSLLEAQRCLHVVLFRLTHLLLQELAFTFQERFFALRRILQLTVLPLHIVKLAFQLLHVMSEQRALTMQLVLDVSQLHLELLVVLIQLRGILLDLLLRL